MLILISLQALTKKKKTKKITISKNSNVNNAAVRIVKKETKNNNLENSKT
jgi:hypothetical protein